MDKELLQRYVEGNVSDGEIETVVAWLDADEANVHEFMALHKLYDISVWNHPAMQQVQEVAERKILTPVVRKLAIELLKVAAVFFVAWLGFQYLQPHQLKEESPAAWQTLHVPAGQRAELTLADGSHLWLNAQSRLSYPSRFEDGKREVRLEGEAYFTVQPDKKRPFIVKTPQIDVRVLGTEFNVMTYRNDSTFEIALLKGIVELLPATQPACRMNVNERVVWENGRFQVSPIRNYDYFRWQEGLICVNNETVGDILKKLERYFDVRIIVKRTDLVNYHYSGKFRTSDGVEHVLRVLQLEHRFRYERDHEQNIITIK